LNSDQRLMPPPQLPATDHLHPWRLPGIERMADGVRSRRNGIVGCQEFSLFLIYMMQEHDIQYKKGMQNQGAESDE
jgi:hypothetical protein